MNVFDIHIHIIILELVKSHYVVEGVDFVLKSAVATTATQIYLLGYDSSQPLMFTMDKVGLHINIPPIPYGLLQYAFTFKMTGLA